MLKKILLITLLTFSISSWASDEDIVVHLATESSLQPLIIAPFQVSESKFSPSYLNEIKSVVTFDFNYNGATKVVKSSKNAINTLELKVEISGDKLLAKLVNQDSIKKAGPIKLSGNLNQDRRQIHKLADTLYKSLTGNQGIAQTKVLYTITLPNKDPTFKSKKMAEVWECDWDGANERQVTHDNRFCVTPFYLPPKKGFAPGTFFYVSYQIGQPKIYIGSLKDGVSERLSSLRGNQLMPCANYQRNLVAFISDIQGNPDLFVIEYNPQDGSIGQPRQLFATPNGSQGSPTFSPDGKKIAFVSNKDGNPRIYMMDVAKEGTLAKNMNPKLLSKRSKESTSPSWSPDGTKISYSAMTSGVRQIWVYDLNTQEESQITSGTSHKENPSWAPDSLHLIFNSCSGDETGGELYIINLNQNESVKISSGPGEKRFPNWEPR
jgi:TolB protein